MHAEHGVNHHGLVILARAKHSAMWSCARVIEFALSAVFIPVEIRLATSSVLWGISLSLIFTCPLAHLSHLHALSRLAMMSNYSCSTIIKRVLDLKALHRNFGCVAISPSRSSTLANHGIGAFGGLADITRFLVSWICDMNQVRLN